MRRILTSIISLIWSVVFGIIATDLTRAGYGMSAGSHSSMAEILAAMNLGEFWSTAGAVGCALASAVFAWSAATSALETVSGWSESDEVARNAFSLAAALIAIAIIAAILGPFPPGLSEKMLYAFALQVAALAACYSAVVAESHHSKMLTEGRAARQKSGARQVARRAAHQAMFPRVIIGRKNDEGQKG